MRRRNATTEFLKECMADALLKLLKEKPLEEITISEITDLADVGRVTFYRNFTKKEDLITYKMSLLRKEFFKDVHFSAETSYREIGKYMFSFIYEIRDILNTLYQANLLEHLFFPLYETIREKNLDNPSKLFANSFLVFGMMGIVYAWIQDGFQETPEELLEILVQIRKNEQK